MSTSSTIYTIGTALSRAFDNQLSVSLLVQGQWIQGEVAAMDGHGILVDRHSDHFIVKMDSICAVQVMTPAPAQRQVHAVPMSA